VLQHQQVAQDETFQRQFGRRRWFVHCTDMLAVKIEKVFTV
jgi:hypothetical protein